MGCLLDQWVSSEARASTFIGFCGFYQDVIVGLLLANSPTLSGPATICQCGVETRGNGRFSKVASQPACKPANATRIDVATLTRAWIYRRAAIEDALRRVVKVDTGRIDELWNAGEEGLDLNFKAQAQKDW